MSRWPTDALRIAQYEQLRSAVALQQEFLRLLEENQASTDTSSPASAASAKRGIEHPRQPRWKPMRGLAR